MSPRLAITLGDPAGIGPEVILKALAGLKLEAAEMTVFGSRKVLEQTYDRLRNDSTDALIQPDHLVILDPEPNPEPTSTILPGVATETTGRLSFTYLQQAIALTLAGQFDGIVTGPIAKSAWKQAGHHYPGQTELLAEMAGSQRYGMLFVAQSPHTGWTLRTLLATTHIPLAQVATTLTPDLLTLKLDLLIESLDQDFGVSQPRIVVAGLNPHSGEQGQLGREEQDWLIPWLTQERVRRPDIELLGPIPPDTLWVQPGQAWFGVQDQSKFYTLTLADAYLALYHDQGLIPLKLMAFDRAVNTTIGLPFVRTSPDHGTAFDIAGKGIADPSSMKAALTLALSLTRHRIKTS